MSHHRTRKCWRCGEVKPLDAEHFHRAGWGQFHYECALCRTAAATARYRGEREQQIAAGWRPWEASIGRWSAEDRIACLEARTVADEPFGFSAFHGPVYPSRRIA